MRWGVDRTSTSAQQKQERDFRARDEPRGQGTGTGMRWVGSQKIPAFPQSKRSLTAGPKSQGLWDQFSESWQAVFHELDRLR